jgi:starch synthase
MRHVLFTEPSAPVAGRQLTIHYNPDNTTLHGAQQVFMRGGYNHWRHPRSYGPLELTPPTAGGTHHTLTLMVPKDAYSLDFVFSDAAEDGRYDNRGGLDYHLPVENSVVAETPLYVVHIAVEMAPICKVGGLGDVVTALGRAVQDQGHLVEVVLPRYDFFLASPLLGGTHYETEFEWAGTRIFVSTCVVEGLRCWFIEPANGMFSGDEVYRGGAQDPGRFAFFCRAALEFLLRTQRQPDILHCHDWSSAEVARAYWTEYHAFGLYRPKVVFTIHNLNYGVQAIGEAAHHCQRFTTVSPTYAWEIGGEPAVAPQVGKLMGIRNG